MRQRHEHKNFSPSGAPTTETATPTVRLLLRYGWAGCSLSDTELMQYRWSVGVS